MTDSTNPSIAQDALSLDGLPVRVVDVEGIWPDLRIGRSVPLGRLEWLWTLRGSAVRDSSTSAKAVFNVSSSLALSEPTSPAQAHEWFRRSYLHILVVTLPELEVYRESPGWSRVRTFVETCKEQHLEYLVICVAEDNEVRANRKVLEKLRAEVNLTTRGRERVVTVPSGASREEVRPISHLHHSPAHQDLLVKLRECARDGVEARVQAYEAETGRSFANRHSPSWSFTQYFAAREGMSFVFVQIGRRDLALRCYEELAALVNERNERGTLGFGATVGADAAHGIVNPDARDVREMIIKNEVTELDFKTYLFARQADLLLGDRKYSELAERGLKFITAISRRALEEATAPNSTVSPLFREAWLFRAARELASALAPSIPPSVASGNSLSRQLATSRERHTARLVAGFHVHALKAFCGLAQVCLPGTLAALPDKQQSPPAMSPEIKKALDEISSDVLRNALTDKKSAVELYSEMANAAASLYEMGGRARGAAALDGDAGVVRLRNDFLVEAEELLCAQCSRFSEDYGWDQLHRRRRVELAAAERKLERVQEYLVSCLTMLFMTRAVRRLGGAAGSGDIAYETEAVHWAAEAVEAASRLPRVMKYTAEKLFVVYIKPNAKTWREGDGGKATVVVESDIPATIEVDSVSVELRLAASTSTSDGRQAQSVLRRAEHAATSPVPQESPTSATRAQATSQGRDLTLSGYGRVTIAPGTTEVEVGAPEIPFAGTYSVNLIALVLGRLKLVQAAQRPPSLPTVTTRGTAPTRSSSAAIAASATQEDLLTNQRFRFPHFFASERPPVATLTIVPPDTLYLLPQMRQLVLVRVVAGPGGVAPGAQISVDVESAVPASQAEGQATEPYVELDDSGGAEEEAATETLAGPKELRMTLAAWTKASGTAEITRGIQANEEACFYIPLRIVSTLKSPLAHGAEGVSLGRTSTLRVGLTCSEQSRQGGNGSSCSVSQRLRFVSPLHVSTRIDLETTEELPAVEHATATGEHDGSRSGGTLLCFIRSLAGSGRSVTVQSARLMLPEWLELQPSPGLSQSELFPQPLHNHGLLTLAFDVRIRPQTREARTEKSLAPVSRLADRTLSRLSDSLDVDRNDGDSPELEEVEMESDRIAPLNERSRALSEAGGLEASTSGGDPFLELPEDVELNGNSNANAQVPPSLEQIDVDDGRQGSDFLLTVDHDLPGTRPLAPRVNGHRRTASADDAAVLDFGATASGGSNRDSAGLSRARGYDGRPSSAGQDVFQGGITALLHLGLRIDEEQATSGVEQEIVVSAFRPPLRRYAVEHRCDKSGRVGVLTQLRFQVIVMPNGTLPEEDVGARSDVLQYEVEADPAQWLISGRSHGAVAVRGSRSETLRVAIIPLVAGRLFLPKVSISDSRGTPLGPDYCASLGRSAQVVVTPPSTVTTKCSSVPVAAADLSLLSQKTSSLSAREDRDRSVAVMHADSFFE